MKKAMQVIIPMTGNGSRFVSEGYADLKPFIQVKNEPMISWIVKKMFSPAEDFIFICRSEHLKRNPGMRDYLMNLAPKVSILEIDQWEKKGPVFDIMKVSEEICSNSPTIISYCDFFQRWDWEGFKKYIDEKNPEGAIPCYAGFHPHLVHPENVYGSCLADETGKLIEIREKHSFGSDKFANKHSPGLYFFRTGQLLKDYFQKAIDSDLSLNGEYYCSLPYNLMVKDGKTVLAPVMVAYFCQWGTPKDLREFEFWTSMIEEANL